ncbi:MAG: hypothetical protein IT368_11405 [Candidatus Hydrogenedentes bacterium]|nr:hypothetical protein [Candidatus Hydrogenedentota bacterium]
MSVAGNKGVGKYLAMAAALVTGLALFAGGVAVGAWFMANFEIVPKGEVARVVPPAFPDSGDTDGNATLPAPESSTFSPAPAPAEMPARTGGPFTFRFKPGETLKYSLKADIDGNGLELVNPEPVKLDMDSAFTLTTKQVDRQGNGDLRMAFEYANLAGDFMGSDFDMKQSASGAVVSMNGQRLVDTQGNAAALSGIPQLAFFDKAIDMKIAPNGEVLSVSGGSGLEGLTQQLPLLTDLEFPSGDIDPGRQWESRVSLPIPGFGTPVDARVLNTFTGYKHIGPRLCAVIEQEITADQTNGSIHMPESALGSALGLSMPGFDLSGDNEVYFDVENGQLVHSEMALHMGMDLGKALGPAGDVLGQLGTGLGDLLGDLPEFENLAPKKDANGNVQQKNLLDLDLDINSTVSLIATESEFSS